MPAGEFRDLVHGAMITHELKPKPLPILLQRSSGVSPVIRRTIDWIDEKPANINWINGHLVQGELFGRLLEFGAEIHVM